MTDLGRGYHIRCRYKNREAAIKSTGSFDVSKDDVDVQRPQAYTSDEKNDRRDHGRSLNHGYVITLLVVLLLLLSRVDDSGIIFRN